MKPDDVPQRTFRCPKGHVDKMSRPFTVGLSEEPEKNHRPLCRICYVNWCAETFPVEEVFDADC